MARRVRVARRSASSVSPAQYVVEGVLFKRGVFNKAFKKRFFRLDRSRGLLDYFGHAMDMRRSANRRGAIALDKNTVLGRGADGTSFQVKTSGRTYVMQAESEVRRYPLIPRLRSCADAPTRRRRALHPRSARPQGLVLCVGPVYRGSGRKERVGRVAAGWRRFQRPAGGGCRAAFGGPSTASVDIPFGRGTGASGHGGCSAGEPPGEDQCLQLCRERRIHGRPRA